MAPSWQAGRRRLPRRLSSVWCGSKGTAYAARSAWRGADRPAFSRPAGRRPRATGHPWQQQGDPQRRTLPRSGPAPRPEEASAVYIPPDFGTVTPYFFAEQAETLVDFLVQGLGGSEVLRSKRPDGRIANAQVRIGTTTVMVSEASAGYPAMRASFYLFVQDAHAAMDRALAAGATLEMAVADMPFGDRQGGVRDPHGNIWWLAQRLVEAPYTE